MSNNIITKGNYSAKITVDGDGWYVVSIRYNDGEMLAAVPGMNIKSFKAIGQAERYARNCLARC